MARSTVETGRPSKIMTVDEAMQETDRVPAAFSFDPQEGEKEKPDPMTALLAEIGDLGQDGSVVLSRVRPDGQRAYIRKFSTSEFIDLGVDGVAREYGPGKYKVAIYGDKGIRAWRDILIDERAAKNQPVLVGAPTAGTPEILELAKTMQQGFAAILAAMQAQQHAPQPSRKEMLEELLTLKTLFASEKPSHPVLENPLEVVKIAAELAEKIHPREGEPSFTSVLLDFADKFAPAINKVVESAAQNQVTQSSLPGAASVSAPSLSGAISSAPLIKPQPQPQFSKEKEMFNPFKMYVSLLINAASNDSDTYPYAYMVLDHVPDHLIEEWSGKPADVLIAELAKADARVLQYADWFKRLHADLLTLLTEEENQAETEEDTEPSSSNVPGNSGIAAN